MKDIQIDYNKISILNGVKSETVEALRKEIKVRKIKKNNIILKENSKAEYVYLILSGLVKLYKSYNNNTENILIHLKGSYEVIGHIGIFDTEEYSASAETVNDTVLLAAPVDLVEDLILSDPIFAKNVIVQICSRVFLSEERIKELSSEDSYSRVARELLKFDRYYGEEFSDGKTFNIGISRDDFASLVGLSREMVSRVLSTFRSDKIIEVKGRKITMLNREKLRSWIQRE